MRKVRNLIIVGVACFCLGMTEIKADRPEELIIAGTNIITAKDNTVMLKEGKELDATYYELKAGSTIITLKPEYLESLNIQDYNLEIFFANGYATPTIKVMPGTVSKAVLPATGLSNNPIYLAVLFLIIGPGLLSINTLTKKENKV